MHRTPMHNLSEIKNEAIGIYSITDDQFKNNDKLLRFIIKWSFDVILFDNGYRLITYRMSS